ncbi:tetratricopeptide repeat protein, partial [Dolichospermum sp. ST_sed4]|nr:tetratricopeptide repeat protein [Dolichospermum sp. ST_sed4]
MKYFFAQIKAAFEALEKGDLTLAKQRFEETAKQGEQNAKQTAEAYRNLGALSYLDNTKQSLQSYQRATQLDPDNADGWNQLGLLLDRIGELDQAIAAYQQVLELGKKHQDQEKIAWAYGNLGNIYKTRGELEQAIKFHHKSLEINQNLGRKEGMANNYGNLGIIYQTRGELEKAVEFYNKSLEINQNLGRKEGMAANYNNLGEVYRVQGKLNQAI